MPKKAYRILFFWFPILILYLYAFDLVLGMDYVKSYLSAFPLWGWLLGYFFVLMLTKIYLKSFSDNEEEKGDDFAAKTMKINSDIVVVFIFSVISFVLIMLLLGKSLDSAINIMN